MRIGFFFHPARYASGHQTYQWTLLSKLMDQDTHEITVVAEEDLDTPSARPPHRILRYPGARPQLRRVAGPLTGIELGARSTARAARADVVVCNAQWPTPRFRGVPRIAILYESPDFEHAPWGLYPEGFKREFTSSVRRCLRRSKAVITISETSRTDIARDFGFPFERVLVAPPALLPFDGSPIREWDLPAYVAVVGWFHPRKDTSLALRAWRWAMERGLDRHIVLAGWEGLADPVQGTIGRRILECVGADLASRVVYTGNIPRPDLGVLLQRADAVALTSIHEGFGIPAIEAMSFGTPVVAVRRASLPEAMGTVGAVVDPTPEALGQALLDSVKAPPDPVALKRHAQSFTAETQVAPFLALFDELSGN